MSTPWPSDHRAVLTTLEVTAGPVPRPLVTAWPARVKRGESLRVRARGIATAARVVLTVAGGDASSVSAAREATAADLSFATADLPPGLHEVALVDASGQRLSTASFWVSNTEARPAVAVERPRVRTGEPIDVRWTEAPGERWDWVGV